MLNVKKTFAISTTTTSLTGLSYTPTYVHVFHNGVRLVDGSDFTATNGTSITLSNSAVSGDEVVVISYSSFQVADHYNKTESDTRFINTAGDTLTGTLGGTAVNLSGDLSAVNTTLTGYLRGPASFTIDPATHADDTGLVIIAGNLQVDGSTTTINSTTLTVDDLNLTLASGAADSAAANGAGITIDGASASLLYSHSGTKFVLNKPLDVTGTATSTTGFTTGANTRVQASSGMLFLSGPSALVFENGAGSEKMRLTSTGLGIDTQVPTAVLDVVGPAARPTSLAEMDSASTARFRSDSSNAESLYIAEGASGAIIQVNDGATNSTTAKNLAIQPFGGNVGIGQTVPVNRLHVSGADGYAYLKLTSDSTGHTASDGSRIGLNGNDLRIINAEAASILFQTQNNERMRITSTGEIVTGGLTSSTGQLHLYKADATGGKLVLQSQVASDATAKISMMSRLLDNSNKTAYIEAYRGNINFGGESGYGNVGIGTQSPGELLHVQKASGTTMVKTEVAANSVVGFNIKKTGTTTKEWKIVDGQTVNGVLEVYDVTNSKSIMSFNSTGSIGIGGVVAASTMDARATGGLHLANSTGISFQSTSTQTNSRAWRIRNDDLTDWGSLNFAVGTNNSDYADASTDVVMTMLRSGNVGIGENNPSHRLHINGGSNDEARVRVSNTAGGQASLDLNNSEGYFRTYTDAGEYRIYDQTDGVHRLVIDTSGNVGIGTTNPGAKLQVQTSHTQTNVTGANSNSTLNIANSGAGNGVYNAIKFAANQQDMYIMSFNNNQQADRRLGFFLGSVAGDATSDERLSILGNGNVGIGTTDPEAPLDITPDSSNKKTIRVQNASQNGYQEYVISSTIGAGAVTITMQCPSYFQAEVVATFQQSNGGTDMNVYYNGIWSNNHTTHLFKNKTDGGTVPRIGGPLSQNPTYSVGVGDAAYNSGKLVFTKPAAASTSGTYCIHVRAYGYGCADMTYVVS